MLPLQGRLVSRAKSEYAGPCPFKGIGDDRFHWWAGSNNWYCRQDCPDCPGEPCEKGGRQGWFKAGETKHFRTYAPRDRPTMAQAYAYSHKLDRQVLAYLATRGILPGTARTFLVGKNCRRLTIPCIATNGQHFCYGIKKRWIGTPPEPWMDTYIMEPGSQGRAIFNYDSLVFHRHKPKHPYVVVVEGVLDCMLLNQLGIPAVAPFGGGGVWDPGWTSTFRHHAEEVLIVADNDEDNQGWLYAEKKREMLGYGSVVFPPDGHKDIGEAHQAGVRLVPWLDSITN